MDSMATRLYANLKEEVGVPEVYRLWPLVSRAFETLLWSYNDRVGPLNRDQREIIEVWACRIIAAAGETGHFVPSYRFRMNAAKTDLTLAAAIKSACDPVREIEVTFPFIPNDPEDPDAA